MPPFDEWDDIGLAIAAILTAFGALVGAIFAWVKWRGEIKLLRAELQPSEDVPELPVRALPEEAPTGTLRDVTNSSHQLLQHLVTQVDALTQTDGRIEAWGKTEHQRLDVRIDETEWRLADHEERLSALETTKEI